MIDPRTGRPCASSITAPDRRLLSDAEIDAIAHDVRTKPLAEAGRHVMPLIGHIGVVEDQRDDLLAACLAVLPILSSHIPPDLFDGHAARALVMVRDAIAAAKGGA